MVTHIERAVSIMGGLMGTLDRIGATRQALWNWRNGKAKISPEYALKIETETAGQVTREQLRPDIYPRGPHDGNMRGRGSTG